MDVGLRIVQDLYQTMQVDAEWSVRTERGFTWWAKDHAQRVWADPPEESDGIRVSRLHARTDLVTGFEPRPENLALLAVGAMRGTVAGVVRHPERPDRLQLATSVYAHAQNREWTGLLFSVAVPLQATEAHLQGPPLAMRLGAEVAATDHPASGRRPHHDQMLDLLEDCILPAGTGPSLWPGLEMQRVLDLLQQGPGVLATGDAGALTAEFPFRGRTALLRVITDQRHPLLGNGLLLLLSLPLSGAPGELCRSALELNEQELRSMTRAPFLGSWSFGGPWGLTFASFLPNLVYRPGLLPNLVIGMANRARWAEQVLA